MKKHAVLALCLGLSVAALTGCGKKAPTAQELIDGMNAYEMDSYTVAVYGDLDMTAKVDGDKSTLSASVDVNAEVEGAQSDDVTTHFVASYSVKADGEKDSNEVEAYVTLDGKDVETYFNLEDTWYSLVIDEDMMETLQESADVDFDFDTDYYTEISDKITDSLADFMYTAEVAKDTVDEEGTECYVMTLAGTGADLQPVYDVLFDEIDGYEDLLDDAGVSKKDFYAALEYIPFTETYYVAVDGGYLVAADFDFSGLDVEGMVDAFGYSYDDLGIESFEVNTFSYGFTFTNVNDTTVEVNDDVKNEAMDMSEMLSYLTGSYSYDYDDDYDWDDDDYDWDDDDDDTSTDTSDSLGDVIDVCDYYGEPLFTCYPTVAGFTWIDTAEDSDGTIHYYTIEDNDDTTIYLNTWGGEVETPLNDALNGNAITDSDFEDYNIEMEEMSAEIEGNTCYFVTETYVNGGSDFLWYYIVCPYTDSSNANEYFVIEIADNYYWEIDTAEALVSDMFY